MTPEALQSGRLRQHTAVTDVGMRAPLEVFYVVHTTSGAVGERCHRICPPLYETPHQAEKELRQLRARVPGGIYSVWKSATSIEPADWLYDVVIADGSVIRARALKGTHHESRLD